MLIIPGSIFADYVQGARLANQDNWSDIFNAEKARREFVNTDTAEQTVDSDIFNRNAINNNSAGANNLQATRRDITAPGILNTDVLNNQATMATVQQLGNAQYPVKYADATTNNVLANLGTRLGQAQQQQAFNNAFRFAEAGQNQAAIGNSQSNFGVEILPLQQGAQRGQLENTIMTQDATASLIPQQTETTRSGLVGQQAVNQNNTALEGIRNVATAFSESILTPQTNPGIGQSIASEMDNAFRMNGLFQGSNQRVRYDPSTGLPFFEIFDETGRAVSRMPVQQYLRTLSAGLDRTAPGRQRAPTAAEREATALATVIGGQLPQRQQATVPAAAAIGANVPIAPNISNAQPQVIRPVAPIVPNQFATLDDINKAVTLISGRAPSNVTTREDVQQLLQSRQLPANIRDQLQQWYNQTFATQPVLDRSQRARQLNQ